MLTKEEISLITQAIREAEQQTTGEIRVYIAKKCKYEPYAKAVTLFHKHKMQKTKHRNGVLIFVSPTDKKAAIVGDRGIHGVAESAFWDDILNKMLESFAQGFIAEGICKAISMVGELIKIRFPMEDGNINELSDDVIFEK